METITFPERRVEPRKKALFNNFARLRRYARQHMTWIDTLNGYRRAFWRDRAVFENRADNGDFETKRKSAEYIKEIDRVLPLLSEDLRRLKEGLVAIGPNLARLCVEADDLCSFREKCHILGVSEQHMRRKMSGNDEEETKMRSLIFVCHGEYRGDEDILPRCDLDMPLWTVAMEAFKHALEHDPEVQQRGHEALACFLADAAERKADLEKTQRPLRLVQ